VGDSAMYENCSAHGNNLKWLSRVPETSTNAKKIVSQSEIAWQELSEGYKFCIVDTKEFQPKERWVLIHSDHARASELKTLEKNIEKDLKETNSIIKGLQAQEFACITDIDKYVSSSCKKIKYHTVSYTIAEYKKYGKKGRPSKSDQPDAIVFKIECTINTDNERIERVKSKKGRFILATNEMDEKTLPYIDMLSTYKKQSSVESGFKFIKDDTFEVDSIFLKKPSRISALMMVMTLCLMVYAYAQMYLRQQLSEKKEFVPDQKKRLTQKPTLQWICRMFHGIHIWTLKMGEVKISKTLNLTPFLKRIISYFGPVACNVYGVQF
jgi:transposase